MDGLPNSIMIASFFMFECLMSKFIIFLEIFYWWSRSKIYNLSNYQKRKVTKPIRFNNWVNTITISLFWAREASTIHTTISQKMLEWAVLGELSKLFLVRMELMKLSSLSMISIARKKFYSKSLKKRKPTVKKFYIFWAKRFGRLEKENLTQDNLLLHLLLVEQMTSLINSLGSMAIMAVMLLQPSLRRSLPFNNFILLPSQ